MANFKLFRGRKELWNFSSSSPLQHLLSRRKNYLPFSSSSSATHRARIHTVASPNNEDTKMIKEFRGFLTKNLLGQSFHRWGRRRHFLAPPTHPRWGDKNWILWRALRFFSLDLLGTRHGSKNLKGQSWLHDWNAVGDRLTLRCDFFEKLRRMGILTKNDCKNHFKKSICRCLKYKLTAFLSKSGESRKAPSVFSRPKQPFFSLFLGKKNKEKTKVEIRRAGWKSGQLNCRHPPSFSGADLKKEQLFNQEENACTTRDFTTF